VSPHTNSVVGSFWPNPRAAEAGAGQDQGVSMPMCKHTGAAEVGGQVSDAAHLGCLALRDTPHEKMRLITPHRQVERAPSLFHPCRQRPFADRAPSLVRCQSGLLDAGCSGRSGARGGPRTDGLHADDVRPPDMRPASMYGWRGEQNLLFPPGAVHHRARGPFGGAAAGRSCSRHSQSTENGTCLGAAGTRQPIYRRFPCAKANRLLAGSVCGLWACSRLRARQVEARL